MSRAADDNEVGDPSSSIWMRPTGYPMRGCETKQALTQAPSCPARPVAKVMACTWSETLSTTVSRQRSSSLTSIRAHD
jgi:hypothetical protein